MYIQTFITSPLTLECDVVMTSLTHHDNDLGVMINRTQRAVPRPGSFQLVNKNKLKNRKKTLTQS